MLRQSLKIGSIPATIWGQPSDKIYIFVHGKYSRKEDAEGFAAIAETRGCQTISFDLPEHGERKLEDYKCTVQNAVQDLQKIGNYTADKWTTISLFGCSLGAYFSLVAYRDRKLEKCLFLSPILDMEELIRNMMKWSNVSEELLREKQEIPTANGEALSWPYFEYVRENPIVRWNCPTYILIGSKDLLTPAYIVDAFATRFHSQVFVLKGGEHYLQTEEQMAVIDWWLKENI